MGRDSREIPLIQESLRLWKGFDAVVGADVGFRQCGILYLCETEADVQGYEPWLEHARHHRIGSRLIAACEVQAVMPGLRRKVAGALYTPSDARAEPAMAAPAIARAVQALGACVITQCAVRAIEKVLGSDLRTRRLDDAPETSTAGCDFAFRKRADGGYTIAHGGLSTAEITPDSFRLFGAFLPALRKKWRGIRLQLGRQFLDEWGWKRRWKADEITPFEVVRVLDPQPDNRLLDTALVNLRKAHRAFELTVEAQRWGGLIDATPDAVPVISGVAALPVFSSPPAFPGMVSGSVPAPGG